MSNTGRSHMENPTPRSIPSDSQDTIMPKIPENRNTDAYPIAAPPTRNTQPMRGFAGMPTPVQSEPVDKAEKWANTPTQPIRRTTQPMGAVGLPKTAIENTRLSFIREHLTQEEITAAGDTDAALRLAQQREQATSEKMRVPTEPYDIFSEAIRTSEPSSDPIIAHMQQQWLSGEYTPPSAEAFNKAYTIEKFLRKHILAEERQKILTHLKEDEIFELIGSFDAPAVAASAMQAVAQDREAKKLKATILENPALTEPAAEIYATNTTSWADIPDTVEKTTVDSGQGPEISTQPIEYDEPDLDDQSEKQRKQTRPKKTRPKTQQILMTSDKLITTYLTPYEIEDVKNQGYESTHLVGVANARQKRELEGKPYERRTGPNTSEVVSGGIAVDTGIYEEASQKPQKQPLWKRAGKWLAGTLAGTAVTATALFGVFGGKEKPEEQSQPEVVTQHLDTDRDIPTDREVTEFPESEVVPTSTEETVTTHTGNEVDFSGEAAESYTQADTTPETIEVEPAHAAAETITPAQTSIITRNVQRVLEQAIDNGTTTSEALTSQIAECIGPSTTPESQQIVATVIERVQDDIQEFVNALVDEHWGDVVAGMQHMTQDIRTELTELATQAQEAEPTPARSTERSERRTSNEATGVDSPEVQRALRNIRERHEAHGGDEEHEERVRRMLTEVRGQIAGDHVVDTTTELANETYPNTRRGLRTAPVSTIEVPPPTIDTAFETIQSNRHDQDEGSDEIIELGEDDLEEVEPLPEPVPTTTPSPPPIEQSRTETPPYHYNGPHIEYLNPTLGLTLEKIVTQYPNGIRNLPPQTIRSLRHGLRANSNDLASWVRISRAFGTLLDD